MISRAGAMAADGSGQVSSNGRRKKVREGTDWRGGPAERREIVRVELIFSMRAVHGWSWKGRIGPALGREVINLQYRSSRQTRRCPR